jgi:cyclic pyranopterin phosphate synthase
MPRSRPDLSFRGLTHLTAEGDARMVDVSAKPETSREAVARAVLRMTPATLAAIRAGNAPKGDVLGVARVAGILAAKRTSDLIPMCHPLRLTGVDIAFSEMPDRGELAVEARVRTVDKTGVEMEALTAVSVAALTVYDMIKAVERGVAIAEIHLLEKSGGKSGPWRRPPPADNGKPGPRSGRTEPRAPISGHPRFKPGPRSGRTEPRVPISGHPRFKPGTRSGQ